MLAQIYHRWITPSAACSVLAVVLAGCGGIDGSASSSGRSRSVAGPASRDAPGADLAMPPAVRLAVVGKFNSPVLASAVPGTDLVAVVEKGGRIRIASGMTCATADRCPSKPVTTGRVALDIHDSIASGAEQGLLGMAFHPSWPRDPRIFINYTGRAGETHIEAWSLDGPNATARRDRELLRIDQPFDNHNGGNIAFGPDGLLYVGMGDGGSAGDPGDRAQSPDEQLGKLLRLDVDAGGERGYGVPKGNLQGGTPEVWGLGLRNPWRFSFDAKTGDLWIGDVGQDTREEVDAVARASLAGSVAPNFGWRRREGFVAFDDSGRKGPGTLIAPVLDYGHVDGCSITGGVVYRGKLIPTLDGWYLFADYCQQDLRMLRAAGVPGSKRREGELKYTSMKGARQTASFGVVQRGEVLTISQDGWIRQVLPA